MEFVIEIFFSICAIVLLLLLVSQIKVLSGKIKKLKSLKELNLEDDGLVTLQGNCFETINSKEGED